MVFTNTSIDLIWELGMREGGGRSFLIVFLNVLVLPPLFQQSCSDAS